jgi:hypothetical protein
MLDVNRWLRTQAATTTPPMLLLDTSHLTTGQTVVQTQTWIHQHWPPQSALRE